MRVWRGWSLYNQDTGDTEWAEKKEEAQEWEDDDCHCTHTGGKQWYTYLSYYCHIGHVA